ncbi:MAG TPA: FAD:protein FMN transferase [Bryobacteraceae bacterium]|nr:FAD:protein FMN transferase [Bryobacteraceae bacterium]
MPGGGSSIYAIGTAPTDLRGWYIRIRHPRDANKTAAEVYLKNQSLSTSGNHEKFVWAESKLYSHIMEPRTGNPSNVMLPVAIVSPKLGVPCAWLH